VGEKETTEKVSQLHTAVFGVEGQGGLYREVDTLKTRVEHVESKVNSLTAKWVALMCIASAVGSALLKLVFGL
jgi:hypothetical protein